jgi:hypothetical protein
MRYYKKLNFYNAWQDERVAHFPAQIFSKSHFLALLLNQIPVPLWNWKKIAEQVRHLCDYF